ncbi:hypothetical protein L0U88_12265 [Flavihumibacter sp. RY-1]|uniref:Uncharacterized protein n=1 Tax=Flavihumibacter fluminis TaxID=2909236 RepID=A0ABS9BJW9_9BACT|nr:hypothetical protein [Flavihumibacter fluminis]MCF1715402.1 hypothetical protein [Flavihumibacter fluminis]
MNSSADPLLLQIKNDLRKKNLVYNSIVQIAKHQGYPVWNKVMRYASSDNIVSSSVSIRNQSLSSSKTLFIPLVKDSLKKKSVDAILIVKHQSDSLKYRLIKKGEYRNLRSNNHFNAPSKDDVVRLFMILEKNVFGHETFKVLDRSLFTEIKNEMSIRGIDTSLPIVATFEPIRKNEKKLASGIVEIEVCEVHYVPGGWVTGEQGYQLVAIQGPCSTYLVWVSDGGGSAGGSGSGSACDPVLGCNTGGGGTGGSGTGGGNECLVCEDGENGYIPTELSLRFQSLQSYLNLNATQSNWLSDRIDIINKIYEMCMEDDFSYEARAASRVIIDLVINNRIQGPYDGTFKNVLITNLPPGIAQAPDFNEIVTKHLPAAIAYKTFKNGNVFDLKIIFDITKEWSNNGKFDIKVLDHGLLSIYNNDDYWAEIDAVFATKQNFATNQLRNICINRGWANGVDPITFNRKVGKAFEETALVYFGLKENRLNYSAPERAQRNSPNPPTQVRPDAIENFILTWYGNNSGSAHIEQLQKFFLAEVKAYSGVLELSSNNWQILGELELAKKASDDVMNNSYYQQIPPDPIKGPLNQMKDGPVLFFITTSDTEIGQSIIDEAKRKSINIWQSKAKFDPATSKITFETPKFIYSKDPNNYKGKAVPWGVLNYLMQIINKEVSKNLLTPVTPNFDLDPEELYK